jgi:hypothetical protein
VGIDHWAIVNFRDSEITGVPEPSIMLLLGPGRVGLWRSKRRFKRQIWDRGIRNQRQDQRCPFLSFALSVLNWV